MDTYLNSFIQKYIVDHSGTLKDKHTVACLMDSQGRHCFKGGCF